MKAIDNAQLSAMAVEPRREIFPLLKRSAEMRSLVVLLAVVPALVSIDVYDIDEAGAQWGIHSLQIFDAGVPDLDLHEASVDDFHHVPPLGLVATAASQKLLGPARPVSLVVPSFIGVVALTFLAYLLADLSGSPTAGLLTALFAGLHPQYLNLAQQPAPVALAVALAAAAILLWYRHAQRRKGAVSGYLVSSGALLGLSFLTAGPIAVAALAVLLLHACWETSVASRQSGAVDYPSGTDHAAAIWAVRRTALLRLPFVALVAAALGASWLVLGDSYNDPGFWSHWWWDNPGPAQPAERRLTPPRALAGVLAYIGVSFGLMVCGVFRAARLLRSASPAAPWVRLVLSWAVVAVALGILAHLSGHGQSASAGMYRVFALIPLLALAALGFESIRYREASRAEVAVTIVLSLAVAVIASADWLGRPLLSSVLVARTAVVGFLLLITSAWLLTRDQATTEFRCRYLLATLLLTLLLVHSASGFAALNQLQRVNNDLDQLRRRLLEVPAVQSCTIVSDTPPPARLVYLLRATWFDARIVTVASWAELPAYAVTPPSEVELANAAESGPGLRLVMSWTARGGAAPNARRLGIQPVRILRAEYVEGRILETFQLVRIGDRSSR